MNVDAAARTEIAGWSRAWRLAAGFAVIGTLPVWNALAALVGLELRGLAAAAVFPIAWIGCLWMAEGFAGVSVTRVERARILGDAALLAEPERRARRAYFAATSGALIFVSLIVLATR
jgi:hypothetical protein